MVILVDDNDNVIGKAEKLKVHKAGLLHRAISVVIINSKNEMLLHKRAKFKYHSPGLWTNACCSHPTPGEEAKDAANRRLLEEMGLKADIRFLFKFKYFAQFENGLTEHEIDHLFIGYSDDLPKINKEEVEEYKYVDINALYEDINIYPSIYTEWFKIIMNQMNEKKIKL